MTRTDVHSGFGSLFSAFSSSVSAVRAGPSLNGAAPHWAVHPVGPHPLARAVDLLLTWSERARQRRELLQFDDHLLQDIGLTRAEAIVETEKPFWRA